MNSDETEDIVEKARTLRPHTENTTKTYRYFPVRVDSETSRLFQAEIPPLILDESERNNDLESSGVLGNRLSGPLKIFEGHTLKNETNEDLLEYLAFVRNLHEPLIFQASTASNASNIDSLRRWSKHECQQVPLESDELAFEFLNLHAHGDVKLAKFLISSGFGLGKEQDTVRTAKLRMDNLLAVKGRKSAHIKAKRSAAVDALPVSVASVEEKEGKIDEINDKLPVPDATSLPPVATVPEEVIANRQVLWQPHKQQHTHCETALMQTQYHRLIGAFGVDLTKPNMHAAHVQCSGLDLDCQRTGLEKRSTMMMVEANHDNTDDNPPADDDVDDISGERRSARFSNKRAIREMWQDVVCCNLSTNVAMGSRLPPASKKRPFSELTQLLQTAATLPAICTYSSYPGSTVDDVSFLSPIFRALKQSYSPTNEHGDRIYGSCQPIIMDVDFVSAIERSLYDLMAADNQIKLWIAASHDLFCRTEAMSDPMTFSAIKRIPVAQSTSDGFKFCPLLTNMPTLVQVKELLTSCKYLPVIVDEIAILSDIVARAEEWTKRADFICGSQTSEKPKLSDINELLLAVQSLPLTFSQLSSLQIMFQDATRMSCKIQGILKRNGQKKSSKVPIKSGIELIGEAKSLNVDLDELAQLIAVVTTTEQWRTEACRSVQSDPKLRILEKLVHVGERLPFDVSDTIEKLKMKRQEARDYIKQLRDFMKTTTANLGRRRGHAVLDQDQTNSTSALPQTNSRGSKIELEEIRALFLEGQLFGVDISELDTLHELVQGADDWIFKMLSFVCRQRRHKNKIMDAAAICDETTTLTDVWKPKTRLSVVPSRTRSRRTEMLIVEAGIDPEAGQVDKELSDIDQLDLSCIKDMEELLEDASAIPVEMDEIKFFKAEVAARKIDIETRYLLSAPRSSLPTLDSLHAIQRKMTEIRSTVPSRVKQISSNRLSTHFSHMIQEDDGGFSIPEFVSIFKEGVVFYEEDQLRCAIISCDGWMSEFKQMTAVENQKVAIKRGTMYSRLSDLLKRSSDLHVDTEQCANIIRNEINMVANWIETNYDLLAALEIQITTPIDRVIEGRPVSAVTISMDAIKHALDFATDRVNVEIDEIKALYGLEKTCLDWIEKGAKICPKRSNRKATVASQSARAIAERSETPIDDIMQLLKFAQTPLGKSVRELGEIAQRLGSMQEQAESWNTVSAQRIDLFFGSIASLLKLRRRLWYKFSESTSSEEKLLVCPFPFLMYKTKRPTEVVMPVQTHMRRRFQPVAAVDTQLDYNSMINLQSISTSSDGVLVEEKQDVSDLVDSLEENMRGELDELIRQGSETGVLYNTSLTLNVLYAAICFGCQARALACDKEWGSIQPSQIEIVIQSSKAIFGISVYRSKFAHVVAGPTAAKQARVKPKPIANRRRVGRRQPRNQSAVASSTSLAGATLDTFAASENDGIMPDSAGDGLDSSKMVIDDADLASSDDPQSDGEFSNADDAQDAPNAASNDDELDDDEVADNADDNMEDDSNDLHVSKRARLEDAMEPVISQPIITSPIVNEVAKVAPKRVQHKMVHDRSAIPISAVPLAQGRSRRNVKQISWSTIMKSEYANEVDTLRHASSSSEVVEKEMKVDDMLATEDNDVYGDMEYIADDNTSQDPVLPIVIESNASTEPVVDEEQPAIVHPRKRGKKAHGNADNVVVKTVVVTEKKLKSGKPSKKGDTLVVVIHGGRSKSAVNVASLAKAAIQAHTRQKMSKKLKHKKPKKFAQLEEEEIIVIPEPETPIAETQQLQPTILGSYSSSDLPESLRDYVIFWLEMLDLLHIRLKDVTNEVSNFVDLSKRENQFDRHAIEESLAVAEANFISSKEIRFFREKIDRCRQWEENATEIIVKRSRKVNIDELKQMCAPEEGLHFDQKLLAGLQLQMKSAKSWMVHYHRLIELPLTLAAGTVGGDENQTLLTEAQDLVVDLSLYTQHIEQSATQYCLCRQPANSMDGTMVQCEGCKDWYHAQCVCLNPSQASKLDKYVCPRCHLRSLFRALCMEVVQSTNRWLTSDSVATYRMADRIKLHKRLNKDMQSTAASSSTSSSATTATPVKSNQPFIQSVFNIGLNKMLPLANKSMSINKLFPFFDPKEEERRLLDEEKYEDMYMSALGVWAGKIKSLFVALIPASKSSSDIAVLSTVMLPVVFMSNNALELARPMPNCEMGSTIKQLVREADNNGYTTVTEVRDIIILLRRLIWCYCAIELIKIPPRFRPLKVLLEDGMELGFAEDRAYKFLTALLTRAEQWRWKAKRYLRSCGRKPQDTGRMLEVLGEYVGLPIRSSLYGVIHCLYRGAGIPVSCGTRRQAAMSKFVITGFEEECTEGDANESLPAHDYNEALSAVENDRDEQPDTSGDEAEAAGNGILMPPYCSQISAGTGAEDLWPPCQYIRPFANFLRALPTAPPMSSDRQATSSSASQSQPMSILSELEQPQATVGQFVSESKADCEVEEQQNEL